MKMNSSTGFQNVDPTRAVSIELVDKKVNQKVKFDVWARLLHRN